MHAFLYLAAPAIAVLLLFAAGELAVGRIRRSNLWLAVLFLAYALVLLRAFLLFSGWMRAVPGLYESTLSANFWMGPLVLFYLRAALGQGSSYWQPGRLLPHFIPGVLVGLFVLPRLFAEPAAQIARYDAAMLWFADVPLALLAHDPYALLTPLALIHVAIYLGLIMYELYLLLNLQNLQREASVRAALLMSGIALTSTLCAFAGMLARTRWPVEFAIGLLALVVPLLYLLQKRYPDLFLELGDLLRSEQERRRGYAQSHLAGVDLSEFAGRLARLMDQERVYERDDLSLPALAALLETTPHRLSEYLNAVLETSFSDYVNQRRVSAACALLRAWPQTTVLSIAYEVGFNSKSAFNAAFARFAGVSPSQYRKSAEPD